MRAAVLLIPVLVLLAGCGAVSGVASVAGSAVGAVGSAAEAAVDTVTYPVR